MKLSVKAKEELLKVLETIDENSKGIRLYSTQGCCGPSVQMDVASAPQPGETATSIDGVDFYIEDSLAETLAEVTLDHNGFGFLMNGLKKSGSCCG
ncbi:MAG: hypothetical protein WBJ36_01160 [Tenuifilum sp.]|uniref:hypothetical protein n=1 Tax=Tenuifilum sp. TaxID=2760880 RepID=UPI002B59E4E2|nr:hypothetical protein [Tenuifilum sp.]